MLGRPRLVDVTQLRVPDEFPRHFLIHKVNAARCRELENRLCGHAAPTVELGDLHYRASRQSGDVGDVVVAHGKLAAAFPRDEPAEFWRALVEQLQPVWFLHKQKPLGGTGGANSNELPKCNLELSTGVNAM